MSSAYTRKGEISAIIITLLLMLPAGLNIVIDASTPLLPSSEVAYTYGYCDTAVTPSTQTVAASDVETEMSNEGISQSLIPTIADGTYVYRMVLTGGGGSASKSELGVCFDGVYPTDSIVKGESDSTEIFRTKIGASTSSMFEFNNQSWVEDLKSPTDTSVYVTLDSKWGTNKDTVITWWLFTSTQINLRFDHPGSSNFDSMVVDEYAIQSSINCDTAVTTSSSQVVEASDVETEMSNDGIDQSLTPTIGAGTYVYRMVLTGGGGDLTISELEVCFDGAVPTDSVVKGNSDAGDIWRTQIDAVHQSNNNTTNSSMFQFNNQGWVVDAESPTSTSVNVILNSKWGSNIDTIITWWLFMGCQIDVRFDHPGTDNFQSMVVDAYRIEGVVADCDTDNDGVPDKEENCPTEAGPVENQGCPWADSDNDGVFDKDDTCPGFDDNIDSDGDGIPDGCDDLQDSDGDGVVGADDSCPGTEVGETVDANGCSWQQRDDDGDGVVGADDSCPGTEAGETVDANGCSWQQHDDDGDGVENNADPCPTSPSGEILSSVEGCTLIEVYMPTLYFDERECYLPINRHWDDFDVSNNYENYRDSRVDDDCSSYSSSSSPTPTVYYEVVEYSDHYVFEYWFYYADSRFEAYPLITSLTIHEHDFEWAFVWVDKSDMEPDYFALSQHYWENEHFISSTDELWVNVEWGGHGMVHHLESFPPWYAQGDGLVLRPGDFEFIQMNPTAADIGMGEFLRGDYCTKDYQCKAPWLQPQFKYPDTNIYDSGPKGVSFYYNMAAGITAQLFSPAELYAQDNEGRITGLFDGEIREEIPLSWYDAEREMVIIFGNGSDYEFFVDGKANATYGLSLSSGNASNITFFNATDIPTNVGEMHHYSVNWSALSENGTSVSISVDFENDGIVDHEFWSDATLNQSEFTTAITPEPETEPEPEPPIIEENLTCPDGFELSLEEECVTTDSTSVVNVESGSISLTSVLAMSILAILAGAICVMFIIRRRKGLEPKVDDVQKQIFRDEDTSQKPTTSQPFGIKTLTPPPEAAGNISEDGYEWLESPRGSDIWYWRMSSDQDWNQWGDND